MPPRSWRMLFAVYALALFTMTHWPRLVLHGPMPRSDLWAHLGAFTIWTALLALWLRGTARPRPVRLFTIWLIGVAYAAIDEGLQAIPALGRNCSWDDFFADVLGVTIGVGLVATWARVTRAVGVGKSNPKS